jgi:hypothetical protein
MNWSSVSTVQIWTVQWVIMRKYCYLHAISKRSQYKAQRNCASKLEARPFFFLNLKGTPSQEEHKTICNGWKICKTALSDQIDFPVFFHLWKMTYQNFISSGIWQYIICLCPVRWLYAVVFRKLTSRTDRLQKINVSAKWVKQTVENSAVVSLLPEKVKKVPLSLWKWFYATLMMVSL